MVSKKTRWGASLVAILVIAAFSIPIIITSAEQLSVDTTAEWEESEDTSSNVEIDSDSLQLDSSLAGEWYSEWYTITDVTAPELIINTTIPLFDSLERIIVLDGSAEPIPGYDWYGRPTIHIDGTNTTRWMMGTRVGTAHSAGNDGISYLFSNDEGQTWGNLNEYFNGSAISGSIPITPDGTYNGEMMIIPCPNGSLVMQIWDGIGGGNDWEQHRSEDNGYTWAYESTNPIAGEPAGDWKGAQQYFINPDNEYEIFCVFEDMAGGKLAIITNSTDNCTTYNYISIIDATNVFEPSIEFVGSNTLVSILRPANDNGSTVLRISTDMGATWGNEMDIADEIGIWERARTYMESNPLFDPNTYMNYTAGEGRLWGIGTQDFGNPNRTICIYYSDSNGADGTWEGPVNLYSDPPNHPFPPPNMAYRDAGYGDIKRRSDGSFCAVSYYAESSNGPSDLVQINFGGKRGRVMIEVDTDGDGVPDENSSWQEIYNETNTIDLSSLSTANWRIRYNISSNTTSSTPYIDSFYGTGFSAALGVQFISIDGGTNGTVIYNSTPTFNWSVVDDTEQYWLQIDNEAGFSSPWIVNLTGINETNFPSEYDANATRVSFTLPDANSLPSYGEYFCRVRARRL